MKKKNPQSSLRLFFVEFSIKKQQRWLHFVSSEHGVRFDQAKVAIYKAFKIRIPSKDIISVWILDEEKNFATNKHYLIKPILNP